MIELDTIKNFRMLPSVLAPRLPSRTVWCVAAFAIFSGWVTLLGWIFEVRRWTDWWNDGISMFVNTALCSIFCGLALILTTFAPSGRRVLAIKSLGVLVAAIGGVTIFEHATGLNLGVDTMLIERSWGQDAATAPMRMGPPAATSFMLLGIAIALTASSPTGRRNATALVAGSADFVPKSCWNSAGTGHRFLSASRTRSAGPSDKEMEPPEVRQLTLRNPQERIGALAVIMTRCRSSRPSLPPAR